MRILTLMGKRTGSGFSLRCLSRSTWILIILGSRVQIPYPVRIKSEKQDLQHGFLIIILQYISTGATEQYCTAQKNVLPVLLSFISGFGSGQWTCNRLCFDADPNSIRIRMRMRIRIQNQGFDDQNLEKIYIWKIWYFFIQSCNILIPRPSALKPEHSPLQNLKFLPFFNFCGCCDQNQCGSMRIWNTGNMTTKIVLPICWNEINFHADSFYQICIYINTVTRQYEK